MDKTPLTETKRKRKALEQLSPFLVFAAVCFCAPLWQLWHGWIGGSRFGVRPPISRSLHPNDFWAFLATEVFVGLVLTAIGVWRYARVLRVHHRF
jgi:hypothetical protein